MIQVIVRGYNLSAKPVTKLTSGAVGREAHFDFSTEWEGLQKIATFRAGTVSADVALLDASCSVPLDVMAESGVELYVGVRGANGAGTLVIPTVWGSAGYIEDGAEPSGVDPSDPEPDWTAQVQAAAAAALERAGLFPSGGTAGQVLKKRSGTDYDTEWADESGGGGGADIDLGITGASVGQHAKVKTVDANGKPTSWAAEAPPKEAFWVTYGTTAAGAVYDKVTANVPVFCRYNDNGHDYVYRCTYAKAFGTTWNGSIRAIFHCLHDGSDKTLTVEDTWKPSGVTTAVWSSSNTEYGTYSKPSGGIPASDLASAVQTSLGKADTALPKTGGTMSGAVAMGGNKITGLANGTDAGDAVNKSQLDAAALGALHPAGSVAFASLPALAAANLNKVYNVTDAFTTTSDFVEGSGKSYPAGTNVAIINTGSDASPVYKYDVYGSFVDLSSYRTATAQDEIDAGKVSTGDYNPDAKTSAMTQAVGKDSNGKLWTAPSGGGGVPSGGTAGQVLKKASGTDYDTEWADESGGGGAVDSVNGKTGTVVLDASDVGAGTYSKPSGGIPKTDLASDVQTSLGKADTALQSADKVTISAVRTVTGDYKLVVS